MWTLSATNFRGEFYSNFWRQLHTTQSHGQSHHFRRFRRLAKCTTKTGFSPVDCSIWSRKQFAWNEYSWCFSYSKSDRNGRNEPMLWLGCRTSLPSWKRTRSRWRQLSRLFHRLLLLHRCDASGTVTKRTSRKASKINSLWRCRDDRFVKLCIYEIMRSIKIRGYIIWHKYCSGRCLKK